MIGVFDSGLGGLTILKGLLAHTPGYDFVYLGDSARNPYGNKSQDLIYEYTKQGVDFLMKKKCQIVIIACNTASAKSLRRIQREWLPENYPDRKVLGVIIPTAEEVVEIINKWPTRKRRKKNRVGLIGTEATIKSQTFDKELLKLNKKLEIHSQKAPLLVPLVEEGWLGRPETRKIIKKYLRPLKLKKINTLILGCTHYPVLLKTIKEIMGSQCQVINPPEAVGRKFQEYLRAHPEITEKLSQNKKRIFYTTDDPDKFEKLGPRFLGQALGKVYFVELGVSEEKN